MYRSLSGAPGSAGGWDRGKARWKAPGAPGKKKRLGAASGELRVTPFSPVTSDVM